MNEHGLPKVLFVDDDPAILASLQRSLGRHLNLSTAGGGAQALALMRRDGPFAVVVTDMRMPSMGGIQLLREVDREFPDTLRVVLTGNADQQNAIESVNSGHIHRFLTKPCPPATILHAVQDALELWTRRAMERELLEGTLSGSIRVMCEVLGMVHPESALQQHRVARMVRHVVLHFHLEPRWQYEVAALLSQIGCVALDASLLDRRGAGLPLEEQDRELLAAHPALGARLLSQLPRMEAVAEMISRQDEDLGEHLSCRLEELSAGEVGGHVLRIALAVDLAMRRGKPYHGAVEALLRQPGFRRDILYALQGLQMEAAALTVRPLRLKELRVGQEFAADVRSLGGVTLVTKGQVLNESMLERLRVFAFQVGLEEPLLVVVPVPAVDEAPCGEDLSSM